MGDVLRDEECTDRLQLLDERRPGSLFTADVRDPQLSASETKRSQRWGAAVQVERDVVDGVSRFRLVLAMSFGVEDLDGSSDEVWLAVDESETEDDRCILVLAEPVCLR